MSGVHVPGVTRRSSYKLCNSLKRGIDLLLVDFSQSLSVTIYAGAKMQ